MATEIEVREGPNTKYPSVVVRLDPSSTPAQGESYQEISLVFKHQETETQIREAINEAVKAHVAKMADPNRGRKKLPTRISGTRTVT